MANGGNICTGFCSGQQLMEVLGRDFSSPEDMKEHMEEVRTFLRGHNLYDIFYGPFRDREKEILRAYIRPGCPRRILRIYWMPLTGLFILTAGKDLRMKGGQRRV